MARLLPCCLLLVSAHTAQGTLTIRVTWDGPIPTQAPIVISQLVKHRNAADAEFCGKCAERGELVNERIVVDKKSRGLRDVAVMVQGPPPPKGTALPDATLDNARCRFQPRVQFVPVGRKVTVTNSDAVAHNARIVGRGDRQLWNGIIPSGKPVKTVPIPVGGTYRVACDLHPWMEAWLIGSTSPWVAVSGRLGEATVKGLPVGEALVVHLWHPTLGRARIDCRLPASKDTLKHLTQREFRKR